MANSLDKVIIEEGPRNAVVRLTGVLDTDDVNLAPAISLSDFTNNDTVGPLLGLGLDTIEYSVGPILVLELTWNSGTPQLIIAMTQSEDFKLGKKFGILRPNMNLSGYDGNINLISRNFNPGTIQQYSIVAKFRKLYANR